MNNRKDLKPDTERATLRMESIWSEAEQRVINDIVRRIKKNGKITSTADYQINRLKEMGKSSEEIEKILKDALNATWPEMFKLYDDVSEWEYVRNKDIYEQVNREFIPPEDNKWLIQMSEAVKEQTKDELTNISQSYGFAVNMNGKTVFMPFAKYYQTFVDAAIMDVISGNFDYNTVLRRVVKQMTNSGLRTVDYASGWSNRTPVAVRRAVMTGISQITGNISDRNAKILDTDHFEVSWHPSARPTHRAWQGKVYSKKELETVCGLGTGDGLCGWNCYHEYYPFIPGVSERMYTDEFLSEQNAKESELKEWHGKQLDAYGITQQQRKMETAMRAQRSKIAALKAGDYDKDKLMLEQAKYQAQLYEYTVFSNKMGIPQQRERIYMDGLGNAAGRKNKYSELYKEKIMQNKGFARQKNKPVENIARTTEDANKVGSEMLGRIYENHRIINDLKATPYDEVKGTIFDNNKADYGKLNVKSANVINKTVLELSKEYDTSLTSIRLMNKDEIATMGGTFAVVRHNYELDSAELIIHGGKFREMDKHVERIKELSKKGYSVKIPDEVADKYVITHEFAHTMMNVKQPLNNKRNWVGADYKKIKKARKEIEVIYEEYIKEVGDLTEKHRKAEFEAITTMDEAKWKEASELAKKLKSVKISNYSMLDPDEFLAESFANEKLGVESNKYAKRVLDVIDKNFKR